VDKNPCSYPGFTDPEGFAQPHLVAGVGPLPGKRCSPKNVERMATQVESIFCYLLIYSGNMNFPDLQQQAGLVGRSYSLSGRPASVAGSDFNSFNHSDRQTHKLK
jgi:hypothetical protein